MATSPPVDPGRILSALPVSRRAFLGTLTGGTVLALGDIRRFFNDSPGAKPVVVQVHHKDAVAWDFKTGWYGERVDQALVDVMLDRAVLELTGGRDVAAAWRSLLPGYTRGRKVAIKVNLNCSSGCNDQDNKIDALAEPVNALVRGMTAAGVVEEDIWIFDAARILPNRFLRRLRSGKVVAFSRWGSCGTRRAMFNGTAPNSVIRFTRSGVPSQTVTDVLVQADYLINMPITKRHGMAGLTLNYKNHFGSIHKCGLLHDWVALRGTKFSTTWNPLVEIMANPHIGGKTVLSVADCLYGDFVNNYGIPRPWATFGGRSPATILVARDQVALDCVQRDILYAERKPGSTPGADSYLKLAAAAGQGVYDAPPTAGGYKLIDHRKLEMAGAGWFRLYGGGKPGKGGLVPAWGFTGVPAPGATVTVEVTGGLPGSFAVVAVGRKRITHSLPFGTLLVDPVLLAFSAKLDGSGRARISLALPPGPGALGAEFTLQAFIADPAASSGISHTGGLHLRIGKPV